MSKLTQEITWFGADNPPPIDSNNGYTTSVDVLVYGIQKHPDFVNEKMVTIGWWDGNNWHFDHENKGAILDPVLLWTHIPYPEN